MSRISIYLLSLLLLFLTAIPSFAETIRILPGPLDGCRIQTPWGDYVAVQNGSTIWVGTQEEYDHAIATAALEKSGGREVMIEGAAPIEHVFISRDMPVVSIGSNNLYEISVNILFGIGPDKKLHRPKKPKDTEYVSVLWVPSKKAKVRANIFDKEANKTYSPFECTGDEHFSVCEFIMPKASLTHSAGIFFTSRKSRPGFLPVDSVAIAHYRGLALKYKGFARSGISLDDDSLKDLEQLHSLDPSIPLPF